METKEYEGRQRCFIIEMPEVIQDVPGIRVFGRRLKSFMFTTDIALIKNTNADAIMAIYPFTSLPSINQTIVTAADIPVFCGIGGTNVSCDKLVDMAKHAEDCGAMGVVTDAAVQYEEVVKLKNAVDIPVVVTVVSEKEDIERKLESGADILNVSAAAETCAVIERIRSNYPYIPVIATGGPTDDSISETIRYGADAISFSPPTNAEIFKKQMQVFREGLLD